MARSVGILNKFRTILPRKFKLQIYFSLVFSHVQYCLLIWGTTTSTNLVKVLTLQKRAVRAIDNLHYSESTGPSFLNHRLLTITAAYHKKLAVYIRNLMKGNWQTFESTYLIAQTAYSLRHPQYHASKSRTNYGFQKLTHIIPHTLNTYPYLTELSVQNMSEVRFRKSVHEYFCYS